MSIRSHATSFKVMSNQEYEQLVGLLRSAGLVRALCEWAVDPCRQGRQSSVGVERIVKEWQMTTFIKLGGCSLR